MKSMEVKSRIWVKNGKPDSSSILPNRKALVIVSLVVGFGHIIAPSDETFCSFRMIYDPQPNTKASEPF